jgi:hypothetical protein
VVEADSADAIKDGPYARGTFCNPDPIAYENTVDDIKQVQEERPAKEAALF